MKLYRNEIRVTVLSKREISDGEALSLSALTDASGELGGGDCVADLRRTIVNTPMTAGAMVQALSEAGANLEFFFPAGVGVPDENEMVAALGDMPPLGTYLRGASLDSERFARDLVTILEKRRDYESEPPF